MPADLTRVIIFLNLTAVQFPFSILIIILSHPQTNSQFMQDQTQENNSTLLTNVCSGNREALDEFLPLVYNELRRLASNYLRAEYGNRTIQTTELVHEAYIKLIGGQDISWQNKAHFFGIAANSMRQILVDLARKRKSLKRGGNQTKVSLFDDLVIMDESDEKLLALDEALKKLETLDERLCKIVELRYFSGLTIEETAEVLSTSSSTVKREWNLAKAWLYRELSLT